MCAPGDLEKSIDGKSEHADVGLDAIELTRAGQPPATEKLNQFGDARPI
jgi:hypothetical protein